MRRSLVDQFKKLFQLFKVARLHHSVRLVDDEKTNVGNRRQMRVPLVANEHTTRHRSQTTTLNLNITPKNFATRRHDAASCGLVSAVMVSATWRSPAASAPRGGRALRRRSRDISSADVPVSPSTCRRRRSSSGETQDGTRRYATVRDGKQRYAMVRNGTQRYTTVHSGTWWYATVHEAARWNTCVPDARSP